MTSTPALARLKRRLGEVADLNAAIAVLGWDQETYLPAGAANARAEQLATLEKLAHEMLTSAETLDLLSEAEAGTSLSKAEQALLRVTRRDVDQATKLPTQLVSDLARATSQALHAWKTARADDAFSAFAPHLETVVQLSRDKADALGYAGERYDALLDLYEPGMTATELDVVFADLREGLVPLVDELASRDVPDEVLHRPYDPQAQWAFGLEVIEAFGYDFERGRQDESAHPFTTTFHVSDVRITTRVDPHFFSPAFFGTLHEAGHGMYEQGVDLSLARTPLADGTSLGMHESQSRLWENLVGRSRPFWRRYFPVVQRHFPEALAGVDEDTFYQAVNRVAPSLIRVEADEVTYNLHIMLRFALERALVAGDLSVRDLPVAWNDRMKSDLGIVPPSDADGCLQDIHWSMGLIGYFPTYSLGNLMSVQLFEAAERDLGDLGRHIEHGQFAPLLGWLRSNVHQFGRSKSASEILHDATGSTLSATPWLNYIETKLV